MFPVLYSPNEHEHFLGFFTSWIRTQEAYLYADPDPKHWLRVLVNFLLLQIMMCSGFQVDDTLKTQMNNFLLSTASQQEIQSLDNKIHETVDTINSLKTSREFFLSFAKVSSSDFLLN